MRLAGRRAALAVAALLLGACATAPTTPEAPAPAPPPVAPKVEAPAAKPAPPEPTARERLAARRHERALGFEREGALRPALDEWTIALTINPEDAVAREGQARAAARIEGAVAEHMREGRAALARGSHPEARRRFLMVLALDPDNRQAFEVLQNETREVPFITHTVRAGETLATIAQRYYGDRSRSEVIWETNQLPPNPRLAAGTTLKIPEIPGLPFVRSEPRAPAPATAALPRPDAAAAPPPPASPGAPAPPGAVAPDPGRDGYEVNPLLADAKEAMERREYTAALADVDHFLQSNPGNREGLDLKKAALYRQGKLQLEQTKYTDSYRTLTQLARLQPDYEDSAKLLQQARQRVIDYHYSEGLRLYRNEQLPQAIAQWRLVLEVDPNHANAKRNIEQAERLQKGLEQRKKK
jgi:tetratricopeptide (TPR) repeat protein